MRSLRSKLVIAFLLISVVIIALVMLFARWNASTEFREYVLVRNQDNFVSVLSNFYAQKESWAGVQQFFPRGPMPHGMMQPNPLPAGEIVLVDDTFSVLIGGRGYQRGQKLTRDQIHDAIPVEHAEQIVGYVVLRQDAFTEQPGEAAFLQRLSQSLLIGSLSVIGLALVLGFLMARSLTRPLQQLTDATRRVAAGDLDVTVDITSQDELGELAQSFNLMNQRLSESRDARRQMTADIAHELRTPVSVLLGYADGLKDDVIPPSQETFDLIQEQAEQLEHLVEDLRTLTRAEAGEISFDLTPTNPVLLVERTHAAFEHQADLQDISLSLEVDGDIPSIEIDPDRFRQVLANLLSNALQYTPKDGQITLRLSADDQYAYISVNDTGPGIPEEDLERIFQRFYRRDPSRSRETGGSGLGLPIAKSLVERQGGQIQVESEIGRGTRFTVTFPRHEAA